MLDVVDLVQQVVLHKQAPQLRALLQALQRLQAVALQEQRPQASELLQVLDLREALLARAPDGPGPRRMTSCRWTATWSR